MASFVIPPASAMARSSGGGRLSSIAPIVDSFSIVASESIAASVYANSVSIHTLIRERRLALRLTEEALAKTVGVTRGAVQQWEREGGTAPKRSIRNKVAEALNISVYHLTAAEATPSLPAGVAQSLSLLPFENPPSLDWEEIVTKQKLPARFVCAVPDDALSPATPRGTRLIFDTQAPPKPGWGVLLEDAKGNRYVRRYIAGAGDRWMAASSNPAYAQLSSVDDGLKILAVASARFDGSV